MLLGFDFVHTMFPPTSFLSKKINKETYIFNHFQLIRKETNFPTSIFFLGLDSLRNKNGFKAIRIHKDGANDLIQNLMAQLHTPTLYTRRKVTASQATHKHFNCY